MATQRQLSERSWERWDPDTADFEAQDEQRRERNAWMSLPGRAPMRASIAPRVYSKQEWSKPNPGGGLDDDEDDELAEEDDENEDFDPADYSGQERTLSERR